MSLIQEYFDCVPSTSLFTSMEPTSGKWQGVEKVEKKRKKEKEKNKTRSWVSRGERFVVWTWTWNGMPLHLPQPWFEKDLHGLHPQLQGSKSLWAQVQTAPQGEGQSGAASWARGGSAPCTGFQKGPVSQPPHVPVCWNLSLRNHCRPHHLVYFVAQRQQKFCTIFILPKVVKMQAGRGGSWWRKHTPLLEQHCFEKLLPSGVESVSWPSGIKRCRDSSRNASSPWPWYLFAKPYRKSVLCVPWKTKQNAGIRKNKRLLQTALHQQTLKKIRCWKNSSLWHVIFQHALKTYYVPSLVLGADRVCARTHSCSSGQGQRCCWNKGSE